MRKHTPLLVSMLVALCSLVTLTEANVIGFDFGSTFFKITLVVPGKTFTIVENVTSQRKTPNQLTVTNEQCLFSSDSFNGMARYPKTTFVNAASMLGQTFNEEELEKLKKTKFVMNDFAKDERGLVGYQMFSLDKKKREEGEMDTYFTEEIVAMILKYGKTLSETQAGSSVRDCVITIPSYFSREQRLMMHQAAEMAGLSVLQMVHENTAAATYFALERMDETPLHVLFYNMGGRDTEVTVARYKSVVNDRNKTVEMVEILGEGYDPALGGSDFDDVLVEMMMERFNAMKEREGAEDVRNNARAVKRLYKDVVKIKEVLSANKLMQVKVPELLDYVTLDTMVHRTEFEERCQPLFDRVTAPALAALEQAGLKPQDIDQVEVIGGGIRVPHVQEILKKTMNKEILHVHLNGDEAMAFGATFIATNSSSAYHMRKIYLTQHPSHDYRISITPMLNETEETNKKEEVPPPVTDTEESKEKEIKYEKEVVLYKSDKDYLGQKKTIQLTYDKGMQIEVHAVYNQELNEGEENKEPKTELLQTYQLKELAEIAKYDVATKEGSTKPKVSLAFELTRSHLLKLNKASVDITETKMEEIKPKKKKEKKEKKEEADKEKTETSDKGEEKKEETTEEDKKKEEQEKADEPKDESKESEDSKKTEDTEQKLGEGDAATNKTEEAEEEPKPEYKEVKVPHTYPCDIEEEVHNVRVLSKTQVKEAKKRIKALEKRDEDKLKNDEAKNNYESLIYEFRGWLNEDGNEVYVTEADRDDHLEKLSAAEDWLDDEGSDAGYKEYQTRTYKMQTDFSTYKNRKQAYEEREVLVPTMFAGMDKWRNEIDELTEKKPWITEGEKVDVLEKIDEMRTWLVNKVKEQAEKKLSEEPVFTALDVELKYKPLAKLYKKVINKKKPREPKKVETEKKEEEKTDEKAGDDKGDDKKEDDTKKEGEDKEQETQKEKKTDM